MDRMAGGEVGVEAVRIESDGGSVKRKQSRVTQGQRPLLRVSI